MTLSDHRWNEFVSPIPGKQFHNRSIPIKIYDFYFSRQNFDYGFTDCDDIIFFLTHATFIFRELCVTESCPLKPQKVNIYFKLPLFRLKNIFLSDKLSHFWTSFCHFIHFYSFFAFIFFTRIQFVSNFTFFLTFFFKRQNQRQNVFFLLLFLQVLSSESNFPPPPHVFLTPPCKLCFFFPTMGGSTFMGFQVFRYSLLSLHLFSFLIFSLQLHF